MASQVSINVLIDLLLKLIKGNFGRIVPEESFQMILAKV